MTDGPSNGEPKERQTPSRVMKYLPIILVLSGLALYGLGWAVVLIAAQIAGTSIGELEVRGLGTTVGIIEDISYALVLGGIIVTVWRSIKSKSYLKHVFPILMLIGGVIAVEIGGSAYDADFNGISGS